MSAGHGDHTDIWDYIEGHGSEIHDLIQRVHAIEDKVKALEAQTPQVRQLQYEADVAAADLAASGLDRHGRDCNCPYCSVPDDDEAAS